MKRCSIVAVALAAACGGGSSERGDEHAVGLDVTALGGSASAAGGAPRRPSETEGRQEPGATASEVGAFDDEMRRGDAAIYSGRFEAAREHYLRALEMRVDAMAPALGAVRAMALPGEAEPRMQIVHRIEQKVAHLLESDETRGTGHILAARLAIALGDPGAALDAAHLAVEELPDMGVAWRVLGEAALSAEHWGEAVSALQTALTLGLEAESGTWERLADALDELGELTAAEDAARQALGITGQDPAARRRRLNLLATIQKHRGLLPEAQRTTESARLLGPDDPAVLHNLGAIAEAANHPDEALAFYQEAVKETPVPMTLWRLGKLQLKRDRPNDALQSFTAAAANLDRWTWPTSLRWTPAYEVGKLYARAERYPDAVGWFEDALREARDADAAREIRSWLAYCRLQ